MGLSECGEDDTCFLTKRFRSFQCLGISRDILCLRRDPCLCSEPVTTDVHVYIVYGKLVYIYILKNKHLRSCQEILRIFLFCQVLWTSGDDVSNAGAENSRPPARGAKNRDEEANQFGTGRTIYRRPLGTDWTTRTFLSRSALGACEPETLQ